MDRATLRGQLAPDCQFGITTVARKRRKTEENYPSHKGNRAANVASIGEVECDELSHHGFKEIRRPATSSPATAAFPEGHRFLGFLSGRRDWVHGFWDALSDVGDVAYCKYIVRSACLGGHPGHIADVLVANAQSYTESNMLRILLDDGLATTEGELWRRQRNLLLPVFSRERLPEYGPIITRHIDRMTGAWKDDSIHDIAT